MINDSGQMSKFCELEKTIIIRFPFRQNNFLQNRCIGHECVSRRKKKPWLLRVFLRVVRTFEFNEGNHCELHRGSVKQVDSPAFNWRSQKWVPTVSNSTQVTCNYFFPLYVSNRLFNKLFTQVGQKVIETVVWEIRSFLYSVRSSMRRGY